MLDDDLTVVRRNLDSKNVPTAEVTHEQIRQQWRLVYRQHFLEKLLQVFLKFFLLKKYFLGKP